MSTFRVVFEVEDPNSDYDRDIMTQYVNRISQLTEGRVTIKTFSEDVTIAVRENPPVTPPAAPLTAPVEQAMIHTVADVRSVLAPKAAKK